MKLDKTEKGAVYLFFLLIFILTALLFWLTKLDADCERRGGTLIRGFTYECVKLERVR